MMNCMKNEMQPSIVKNVLAAHHSASSLGIFADEHFKNRDRIHAGYSVNRKRISLFNDSIHIDSLWHFKLNTGRTMLCISNNHSLCFWEMPSLKFIRKILLPNTPDKTSYNGDNNHKGLRSICFVSAHHIAVGYMDGFLEVFNVRTGCSIVRKKIGGHVESITASADYLAASIFSNGVLDHASCGISIFDLSLLLNNKIFRVVERKKPGIEIEHVLPSEIRFAPNGTELLAVSAQILPNGNNINRIEVYSLFENSVKTILEQESKERSFRLSGYTRSGGYLVSTEKGIAQFDGDHSKIMEFAYPEPSFKFRSVEIDLSGNTILCRSPNGDVFVLTNRKTGKWEKQLNQLWVSGFIALSSDYFLCLVENITSYDLALVDAQTMRVLRRIPKPVHRIFSKQYDVAIDGSLLVADMDGGIGVFDKELNLLERFETTRGTAQQVLCYSNEMTVAMLSISRAITKKNIHSKEPSYLHIAHFNGQPVESGSNIYEISSNEIDGKDGIWFVTLPGITQRWISKDCRWVVFYKSIMCQKASDIKKSGADLETVNDILFDEQIIGSAYSGTLFYCLFASGDLMVIDPMRYSTVAIDKDHQKIVVDGDAVRIQQKFIDNPGGIDVAMSDNIVIWNDKRIRIVKNDLNGNLETIASVTAESPFSILWDKYNKRFILNYQTHLEFLTETLEPICSLYLLSGMDYCIYMPVLEENEHPGYFWSSCDCCDLFDVTDEKGMPVKSHEQKAKILDRYKNKTIVYAGINDRSKFKRMTTTKDPKNTSGTHFSYAGLLPSKENKSQ